MTRETTPQDRKLAIAVAVAALQAHRLGADEGYRTIHGRTSPKKWARGGRCLPTA